MEVLRWGLCGGEVLVLVVWGALPLRCLMCRSGWVEVLGVYADSSWGGLTFACQSRTGGISGVNS